MQDTMEPPHFDPDHCAALGRFLFEQVEENSKACDLEILCEDGETLRVHSCVVSMIPFFKRRENFLEKGGDSASKTVHMHEVSLESLKIILKYTYTGEIDMSADTLSIILDTVFFLDYEVLIKVILDWIFSLAPTLTNVSTLRMICDHHELEHPGIERLHLYFDGQVPELLDGDYLLDVEPDTLGGLISNENYRYTPQGKFADFLLRWTLVDLTQREKYFPDLFEKIDLSKIDKGYLEELQKDPLIQKFPDVCTAVKNAQATKRRKKPPPMQAIIAAGGKVSRDGLMTICDHSKLRTTNVWAYLIPKKKWVALTKLPEKIEYPSAAIDGDGQLCVVSQEVCYGKGEINLHRFNFQQATWTTEQLTFSGGFEGKYVKELVACQGQLYIVILGVRCADKRLLQPTNACVFRVQAELTKPVVLKRVSVETKVKVCELGDQFLVHLKDKKLVTACLVHPRTKSSKELAPKMAKNLSHGFLCCFGCGFVQYMPGRQVRYYELSHKQNLNLVESFSLPSLPGPAHPPTMTFTSLYGDLVAFGGVDGRCGAPQQASFHFDYEQRQWNLLPNLPDCMVGSAALCVKLPSKFTNCTDDCPHCAVYQLDDDVIYKAPCVPSTSKITQWEPEEEAYDTWM